MYDRPRNFNPEIKCSHDDVIEDYHEGTVTCLNCHRVIDGIYLSPLPQSMSSHIEDNNNKMHTYIKEIGEKENISLACIYNILNLYDDLYKDKGTFNSEEIALFCIYITLKIEHNPIMLDRLCYYFPNVKNKNIIYKMEEQYYINHDLDISSLNDLAHRIFSQLGISPSVKHSNILKKIFNDVQEKSNLFFNTILAILIIEYCEHRQLNISQIAICSLCYVTRNNVLKAKKNCPWIKNAIEEIKKYIT